MDINLECNVSLSKKLRSVLGDSDGRVVLIAESIRNGTGKAMLVISGDKLDVNTARQSIGKETSIQFTPSAVKEDYPAESTVSNIFSSGGISKPGPRTAVDRIAATTAPELGQLAHAIKRQEEIVTPKEFEVHNDPEFHQFVSNFSELMMAVKAAMGKESEINPDSIEDPRQKALAIEMKEQAEAIDIPAYVVNDQCGSIRLNDIDLTLGLNIPVNLSNISAKRLASSGDLKLMIKSKMVKFIDPETVPSYRTLAAQGVVKPGLDTYSTIGDAENAIGGNTYMPQAEEVNIPVNDEAPTDQEQLAGLINLTSMGDNDGGLRVSQHGAPRTKKMVAGSSSINAKGIKTIAKV